MDGSNLTNADWDKDLKQRETNEGRSLDLNTTETVWLDIKRVASTESLAELFHMALSVLLDLTEQ